MPVLAFSGLSRRYGAIVALQGVDLTIGAGEVFGLLGPNGAGKTSFLRILMGLLEADSGTVMLDGRPITPADRDRVGYLPEERGLYRKERVDDVLAYFAMLKGLDRRAARQRVGRWLERLGIPEVGRRRIDTLSKGIQQKVQIAGALVHDPEIVVLDEPFTGLDPLNTILVKDLLRASSREGRLVILSTHQMPLVEELCDRVALIDRGRIVLEGRLETIRRQEGKAEVLVSTDGDLAALPLVASLKREGALWRVVVAAGARPSDLLSQIAGRGFAIDHFEVARPRLEEIFVRAVGAGRPS